MMQQSCNGNMVGPCSCGYYHHHHHGQTAQTSSNSFSMLFHRPYDQYEDQTSATASYDAHQMYNYNGGYPSSPPSSSAAAVDCTLSLGTPATRSTVNTDAAEKPRRSSYMRNFCWDILQSKQSSSHQKSSRASYSTTSSGGGGGEVPNGRRCANCDTTSTPLWRNGPKGPKSLCNACGIRFKKEERRASAAAATIGGAGNGHGGGMEAMPQYMTNGSWVQHHHSPAAQRIPYFSNATAAYGGSHEFRFMEDADDHRDSDAGLPYLSWRLNVTDRPGLVHDFTR